MSASEEMRRRNTLPVSDPLFPHMDASDSEIEFHSNIDFDSIGLYVPALQIVSSIVVCCLTALSLTWFPLGSSNAARTLAVCSVVGMATTIKPIRVTRTRGLDTLFHTIRPAVLVYLTSMIVEQLCYSCERWQASHVGSWRDALFHVCGIVSMFAGFARAYRPQSSGDAPFAVTCAALFVMAMVPHSADESEGPLCGASSPLQAAERITRAFIFGVMYCITVFTGEYVRHTPNDVLLASMRACAASLWILIVTVYFLPCALGQIVLTLWARFQRDEFTRVETDSQVDDVETKHVETDSTCRIGVYHSNDLAKLDRLSNLGSTESETTSGFESGWSEDDAVRSFRIHIPKSDSVQNDITPSSRPHVSKETMARVAEQVCHSSC